MQQRIPNKGANQSAKHQPGIGRVVFGMEYSA